MDIISYSKAKKAEQLAQSVIDGEFDLGVARTAIDTKLTALETQYEPQLNDTKTRVSKIESNLSEQESQTQTLTHGLNVINSDQPSPLKVEFYGQTRVNLLGREGGFHTQGKWGSNLVIDTTTYKFGTSSGKFDSSISAKDADNTQKLNLSGRYILLGVWAKSVSGTPDMKIRLFGKDSAGSLISTNNDYRIYTNNSWKFYYKKFDLTANSENHWTIRLTSGSSGTTNDVINLDGLFIQELTNTQYNKIGVSLTDTSKPSISDVFPYVDSVQHTRNVFAKVSGANLAPTNVEEWEVGTFGANGSYISNDKRLRIPNSIKITPDTEYVYSADPNYKLGVYCFDVNGVVIGTGNYWHNPLVFTTPPNTDHIKIFLRHNDELTLDTGHILTAKPMLNLGSTAKPFTEKNDSYIYAEVTLAGNDNEKDILSYNEEKRRWEKTKWWETDVVLDGSWDWTFVSEYNGYKYISIPFNKGQLMDSQTVVKYDGYILKNELQTSQVVTGADKTRLTTASLLLTIFNSDSEGYDLTQSSEIKRFFNDKNYFLSYQLAEPVTEVEGVDFPYVEGDLAISGDAQVEVGEGVIVREKVTPVTGNGTSKYHINNTHSNYDAKNLLKRKTSRIINIYKNGVSDIHNWITTLDSYAFGKQRCEIDKTLFDTTAEYTVTYEILDKHDFTTNLNEVKATYQDSIKSSFSRVVEKQSDMATDLSINKRSIIDLYVRMKALESGV